MTFTSKKKDSHKIEVEVKHGKIKPNRHGFIVITKGSHYLSNSIRVDIFERDYIVPEGIIIDD